MSCSSACLLACRQKFSTSFWKINSVSIKFWVDVGELKSRWNRCRPTFMLLLFSFETSNRRNRVTPPHVKGTSDERGCYTINDNGNKIPEWRTFFSEKKIGTGFVEACDDESIHFLGAGILIWISRNWGHTFTHTHTNTHTHPSTHTHTHTHPHTHPRTRTRTHSTSSLYQEALLLKKKTKCSNFRTNV